jgi:hypothetical protein
MQKIGMTTRARTLVLSLLATFAFAAPAEAASPALLGVGHDGLHPTATLSAPGADDVTVYISKRPDRATDGNFLTENSAEIDFLTGDEIASGVWMDADNLDPGTYYVMLRASTYTCPDGADCIDGFSNVMTLLVPKPKQRFRASIERGFIGSFKLTSLPRATRFRTSCAGLEGTAANANAAPLTATTGQALRRTRSSSP